jgi:hypothetical protein
VESATETPKEDLVFQATETPKEDLVFQESKEA